MNCTISRGNVFPRGSVWFCFVIAGPVKAAYVPPLERIKPFVVLCFPSESGRERIHSVRVKVAEKLIYSVLFFFFFGAFFFSYGRNGDASNSRLLVLFRPSKSRDDRRRAS